MNKELWKDISGYEGKYQVSNLGNVFSTHKKGLLALNMMRNGYACVHLYKDGRSSRKPVSVHKLVAMAFVNNPLQKREVNHINFIKTDNRAENLEWVSRAENVAHAVFNGRRHYPEKKVKGIHLRTKEIRTFDSQISAEIAIKGKQTGRISQALKNNRPAYGYVWWMA